MPTILLPLSLLLSVSLALPSLQAAVSGDPRLPEQWALERVGAACAWNEVPGAPVTVAVVDSGVDLGHPDLAGQLRPDGYDFVNGDSEPHDENGHGTHVAGLIAAVAGNGEGIAGLAPGVQLLPVRVVDRQGFGDDGAIAEGIRYAADQGAQVINVSLGASLGSAGEAAAARIGAAISYAQERGALVVAAAGNDGSQEPNAVVAANDAVLVVGASDQDDARASFSNYGPWVDLLAPGVDMLSTMPTYETLLTSESLPPNQRYEQGYDALSGTSQAAPLVAAVAALLFSRHPQWSAAQVAGQIIGSARQVADGEQPAGLLDACAALGPLVVATVGVQRVPSAELPQPWPFQATLLAVAGLLGTWAAYAWRGRWVRRPADGSWGQLTLVDAGRHWSHELHGTEIVVGRGAACDVVLGDGSVSRQHLRLFVRGGQAYAEDIGSSYGSYRNGQRLATIMPLRPDDVLTLGETTLRVTLSA